MDRNCVVTGELFPFEFTADFSTYIKVRRSLGIGLGFGVDWGEVTMWVQVGD